MQHWLLAFAVLAGTILAAVVGMSAAVDTIAVVLICMRVVAAELTVAAEPAEPAVAAEPAEQNDIELEQFE